MIKQLVYAGTNYRGDKMGLLIVIGLVIIVAVKVLYESVGILAIVIPVAFVLLILIVKASRDAETAMRTYYVSAEGNDTNDGLTEAAPFQSLARAVAKAYAADIKRITVIGTLNASSEHHSEAPVAFFIPGRGTITITGKPDASEAERAVLCGEGKVNVAKYILNFCIEKYPGGAVFGLFFSFHSLKYTPSGLSWDDRPILKMLFRSGSVNIQALCLRHSPNSASPFLMLLPSIRFSIKFAGCIGANC
ncbi:MAG: hypothetical protein LBQ57_08460 [Spirochaetales bacterium]|nr:hypothetical protein [Spirochaetales bacterium]